MVFVQISINMLLLCTSMAPTTSGRSNPPTPSVAIVFIVIFIVIIIVVIIVVFVFASLLLSLDILCAPLERAGKRLGGELLAVKDARLYLPPVADHL